MLPLRSRLRAECACLCCVRGWVRGLARRCPERACVRDTKCPGMPALYRTSLVYVFCHAGLRRVAAWPKCVRVLGQQYSLPPTSVACTTVSVSCGKARLRSRSQDPAAVSTDLHFVGEVFDKCTVCGALARSVTSSRCWHASDRNDYCQAQPIASPSLRVQPRTSLTRAASWCGAAAPPGAAASRRSRGPSRS